jgi:23S rRNA (cytosine1962-C5)-methyltransferase
MNARVVLQPRRARPFYGRHPWVYAGAIDRIEGEPRDGDVVDLFSHAGDFVARGLYNSQSKIRVRLYTWSAETTLDAGFFGAQIDTALALRQSILHLSQAGTACRLIFSEADGLSGLTVDRYDRWLVVQFTGLGLAQRRDLIADLLMERLQPDGILLRTERGIGRLEGLELHDGILRGSIPAEPVVIAENGVRFLVHLAEGQKTGFYLDQRDNRAAVAALASGRRMLDAFCYTGGFGLHAARAGAREVIGVDVSEPALALARANAGLNELSKLTFIRGDAFDQMASLAQAGERFGLVVLDPPKFARARNAVEDALRGYDRLHSLALRLLDPDGILVSCCCSGLIDVGMLEALLAQLAAESGRDIQILQQRGQAADHPVSVACPESIYLKCLISRVR